MSKVKVKINDNKFIKTKGNINPDLIKRFKEVIERYTFVELIEATKTIVDYHMGEIEYKVIINDVDTPDILSLKCEDSKDIELLFLIIIDQLDQIVEDLNPDRELPFNVEDGLFREQKSNVVSRMSQGDHYYLLKELGLINETKEKSKEDKIKLDFKDPDKEIEYCEIFSLFTNYEIIAAAYPELVKKLEAKKKELRESGYEFVEYKDREDF